MTHVLDEAIALTPVGSDSRVFRAQTHPAYANMVGPFGGITAATVIHGLQQHPDVLGEPLSLTINFVAPIAYGEWDLHLDPVRTNRTNQHWVFSIRQEGVTVATGSAVFAVIRDTWADVEAAPPEAVPAAEVEPTDFLDFIAWAKNYDKRFLVGGIVDGETADDSTSTLWVRDQPERPIDFPSLASMADCFFPRIFLRHGVYMPAGTISMTTYFHATAEELAAHGTDHVLATARGSRFGHGHFDQFAELWSGETLLATTHQLVYYKDPKVPA
ncbi:acyl-CoA thioesterase [Gordonia hydrophobica]|uniref:Thioesterase family protein n=1 Tax=Gordonia hydrophobica TaxID=40516 RepID=A0ABZ2U7E8_9ACTN|nr:thioesterase family protein [Gordonia hydrophobica]MBM7368617.1 acyl-CoA thioesterase [Gordonia hydrophobica]